MIIGILGAMYEEIKPLHQLIDNIIQKKYYNYIFYIGNLLNIKIIFLISGIGKVAASIASTILINKYHPNLIINIGTAGSIHHILKTGNIVLANTISYYDVNITKFGYKIGQIPSCPQFFLINQQLLHLTTETLNKKKIQFFQGLIVTGDAFIHSKKTAQLIKKKFHNAIAVDMESAAIAHVCFKLNTPLLTIKCISDYANNTGHIDFKIFIHISSQTSCNVLTILLNELNKNTKIKHILKTNN
ncbi:MAG: 5'-methylthioadenosine/adenosylhomocysteine nucleosidase [Buchnera aphidicola (Eriosoma harunire)]